MWLLFHPQPQVLCHQEEEAEATVVQLLCAVHEAIEEKQLAADEHVLSFKMGLKLDKECKAIVHLLCLAHTTSYNLSLRWLSRTSMVEAKSSTHSRSRRPLSMLSSPSSWDLLSCSVNRTRFITNACFCSLLRQGCWRARVAVQGEVDQRVHIDQGGSYRSAQLQVHHASSGPSSSLSVLLHRQQWRHSICSLECGEAVVFYVHAAVLERLSTSGIAQAGVSSLVAASLFLFVYQGGLYVSSDGQVREAWAVLSHFALRGQGGRQENEKVGDTVSAVALDPGVRIFQTAYENKGVVTKYGEGDAKRIVSIGLRVVKLVSELATNKKLMGRVVQKQQSFRTARVRKKYWKNARRRTARRLRMSYQKMDHLKKDAHWKVAKDLCARYDHIMVPTLETSQMVERVNRRINSDTVRKMLHWSHYEFRQKLKHTAVSRGCA